VSHAIIMDGAALRATLKTVHLYTCVRGGMLHPRVARLFSDLFEHESAHICVAALEAMVLLLFVGWHIEQCLAEEMQDRSLAMQGIVRVHSCIDAFSHRISHMVMKTRQSDGKREREREKKKERKIAVHCGSTAGREEEEWGTGTAKDNDVFVRRELISWLGFITACWLRLLHFLFSLP